MKRITALATGMVVAAIAAASVATATAAGTLPTLALTMTGKSITATSTVPAGAVNIVSTVSGEAVGSPTLVRLDPGVTFAQAFGAAISHGGDPNALDGLAAIVANPMAPKGTSNAQTVLTPGNYVALDTTAGNPNKWPHVNFTVAANPALATLSKPSAPVTTEQFRFTGPRTLHDGQLIRYVNDGYLYHMVIAIPAKNKVSAEALDAALLANNQKKANKLFAGAPLQLMGTVAPGAMHQQVLKAKPGFYVLACFMNTQDGRVHTQLGMERVIHIVK